MLDLPNIGWAVGILLGLGAGFAGAIFAGMSAEPHNRRRTFLRWTLTTALVGSGAILGASLFRPCIFGPAAGATFLPTSLTLGLLFTLFNPSRGVAPVHATPPARAAAPAPAGRPTAPRPA